MPDTTTWADGFGLWHAITSADVADAQSAAADAIQAELLARENGPIRRTRVQMVRMTPHGAEWVEL